MKCLRCDLEIIDDFSISNLYHLDCYIIEDANDRICYECHLKPTVECVRCTGMSSGYCEECLYEKYGKYCRICN